MCGEPPIQKRRVGRRRGDDGRTAAGFRGITFSFRRKRDCYSGRIALNRVEVWEFAVPEEGDKRVPEMFSQEVPNAYGYGHDVLYNRVVESILDGAPVEISAEEGRKALELVHAIYASHEQGARVYTETVRHPSPRNRLTLLV